MVVITTIAPEVDDDNDEGVMKEHQETRDANKSQHPCRCMSTPSMPRSELHVAWKHVDRLHPTRETIVVVGDSGSEDSSRQNPTLRLETDKCHNRCNACNSHFFGQQKLIMICLSLLPGELSPVRILALPPSL